MIDAVVKRKAANRLNYISEKVTATLLEELSRNQDLFHQAGISKQVFELGQAAWQNRLVVCRSLIYKVPNDQDDHNTLMINHCTKVLQSLNDHFFNNLKAGPNPEPGQSAH